MTNQSQKEQGRKIEDIQIDFDGMVCYVCGSDDCICEGTMCSECSGKGDFVNCIDDMCYGQDECIHGDEPIMCRECAGEGVIYPRRIPEKEYWERREKTK